MIRNSFLQTHFYWKFLHNRFLIWLGPNSIRMCNPIQGPNPRTDSLHTPCCQPYQYYFSVPSALLLHIGPYPRTDSVHTPCQPYQYVLLFSASALYSVIYVLQDLIPGLTHGSLTNTTVLFSASTVIQTDSSSQSTYMYIRVGRFCLFWNFIKSHGFAVPLGKIWGTTKFFLILVQKPVRATPLKVHNFKKIQGAKNKKIKKNSGKMCSFIPILFSKIIKSL